MLSASEAYVSAAKAGTQYARIKVELGAFGISQDATGAVSATFTEDDVVECSVSNSVGDGGSFGIGSTESAECSLKLLTDSVKPYLDKVKNYDYRVSYGYDLDSGATEWLVMGVFATDRSLVEKSGMYTDITMYDAMYWLDRVAFSGVSAERGTAASVASMLADVCEQAGMVLASDSTVPDVSYSMMRPRTGDGATVRSAIGDLAAMCFCNATAYDGRLHLVKLPDPKTATPTDKLTPDDFRDVPSFDFAESCVSSMTGSVTNSSSYQSEDAEKMVKPACKLVKANGRLGALFIHKKRSKAWKSSHYVLYIYRDPKDSKDGNICGVKDTDSPTSMKWAKVKATTGPMKGKSILDIYDAGKLLGTVVKGDVAVLGKRTLDLKRYKSVYLKGKNTKFFPDYEQKDGNKYAGTFNSSLKVSGPGYRTANRQYDWKTISEWRGDDTTVDMEFDGTSPVFDDTESESDEAGESGNAIELAPELFADGGTVNTLKSNDELNLVKADFSTLCSLATIPYTFVGSSTSMFGRNHYSVGDLLRVEDVYGDTYSVPVMTAEYSYGGGILTELGCDGADTDGGASSYGGSASTSSKVDSNAGKIDSTKADVADKISDISGKADAAEKLAEEAKKSAEEAIAKADSLDDLSYRIQVDSLASGQLASGAYDSVHPIVTGMKDAIAKVEEQASQIEGVKESGKQTIEVATSLAKAVATYSYETEKSAVRWKQTYSASIDAWASDDPDTQAKIKAAYAKLYGENGTAENPTDDSAQGKLNAAKKANIEAAATESEMKTKLAEANAYQAACVVQVAKDEASYKKAKAAYNKLKKKATAKRKQIDAARIALNASKTKRDESAAKVNEANTRCEEASANYASAKAALADAETKVDAASAEVETAMNGIHQLYESTISQTAKGIKLTANETAKNKKRVGELEVTARQISSDVKTMDEKTGALMKATNMTQTDSGFTWSIVDNTARKKATSAASDAAGASLEAASAKAAANEVKTIVRTFSGGVFVGKYPNTVGALVNSNGSFDVIGVNWTNNNDGTYTPSESSVYASFGNSAVLNGTVVAKSGITLSDTDVHSEGSYPPGHSGSGLFASGVGIMTGSGGSNHGMWSTIDGSWIIYRDSSGDTHSDSNISTSSELQTTGAGTSSSAANCRLTTKSPKGTIRYGASSSARYKHDISGIEADYLAPELLYDLPVRQFIYNDGYLTDDDDRNGFYVPGLIAEEVAEFYPMAADLGEEEKTFENWNERYIIPPMLALIQQQKRQIDELTSRVSALEERAGKPEASL